MKRKKILDFPIIRQSTNYSCSCATLQACLRYYGIDKREKQIIDEMNISYDSPEIHPSKIITTAKKYGLKAKYEKLTIENLMSYVNHGIPVIVNFQAWSVANKPDYSSDNNGHYAVVIGYDKIKSILFFSDPSSYNKCYLSFKEFETRWHDGDKTDEDYDHMGVVVFGKKNNYNSKKLIKLE